MKPRAQSDRRYQQSAKGPARSARYERSLKDHFRNARYAYSAKGWARDGRRAMKKSNAALVALGFSPEEVDKALNNLMGDGWIDRLRDFLR